MSKTKQAIKILAIDPGSRYVGVAVLRKHSSLNIKPELLYWAVKSIKDRATAKTVSQQGKKIITDLIDFYQPDIIVQEKLFFTQCKCSENLKTFVREIKRLAKKKRITYVEYAPTTVRKHICQNGWATKKDTATIIVSLYPELAVNLTSDREWKVKYWYNMFDAVALGLCYWQNLNNRSN